MFAAVLCTALLSACSAQNGAPSADGINDPYEAQNRRVHAFNRGLDRAIVRPAGKGYTAIVPDDIEDSVGNFSTNLGQPSVTVNSLLQGDMRGSGISLARFVINSTLGIGGLFDVATDFGIEDHDTDFGETLYVWGVGEGSYIELPLLGPSTARHTAGRIVDLFTNPLSYNLDDPESYIPPAATVASRLGDRGRYSDTVDAILYESADSYAQARLIYLQNRRFQLGAQDAGSSIDPFELNTEGF
ncbi:VacJ family lipoprotein [Aliishimia ponticola]|uniref:VacJ family lipoprotein n=1 Tax=Aliishimia ponticola TaxID=2499833 RepID=A0A4S4NE31_9RHOB|nr:VacJ family lipoprotein [Aliishimia ponticola]THH37005.1 VacJ family lipoprotein [Aliishimia ponticola]